MVWGKSGDKKENELKPVNQTCARMPSRLEVKLDKIDQTMGNRVVKSNFTKQLSTIHKRWVAWWFL